MKEEFSQFQQMAKDEFGITVIPASEGNCNSPMELQQVLREFCCAVDYSAVQCSYCGCKPEIEYTSSEAYGDAGLTYRRFTKLPKYCPNCGAKMREYAL